MDSPIISDRLLSFVSARVYIKVELVSWSTVAGRSRKEPRTLGLLLAVSLASGYVPGLDLQRELPQGFFCQVVAEVVEEGNDVFVPLQLIMPETRRVGGLINAESRENKSAVYFNMLYFRSYTCWKRRMLSRMLNCCQRLEKLTFPSM